MIPLVLFILAAPDLSGMLKLTGGDSIAHACPIAMDRALTNQHVMSTGSQMVWGVGNGEEAHGIVESTETDRYRDLSYIKPISVARFPRWYPIAKSAPKIGDRIYFIGYDWADRKKAFGPEQFDSKVTQVLNGNIAFEDGGKGGSSGSCVLNEAGEVVAINKGGKDTENNNGIAGFAVGVWGDWLSLEPDPIPEPEVREDSPCFFSFAARFH